MATTSTNDIGIGILTALGANSLDVSTIAQTLAKAEVGPQQSNLDKENTKYTAMLNGYDTLQQAFNGFASQISTIGNMASYQQKTVTSSDSSVIDATVTGSPSNASYQVEVQSVASAQTLASQTTFSSSNATIGQGTLTFNVGGTTTDITIDSTNDTLTGIQSAVNAANIGVNATVVNTGSGYKLVFSSAQTGASNQMTITTTDSDGNNTDASGLSQLVNANMTQTIPGQDATLLVNGLTVTSSSNNVTGAIDGVTLNVKSADIGSVKTLEIGSDTSGLNQSVSDFVDLYNSLNTIISTLGSYASPPTDASGNPVQGDQTGILKGDSTLQSIKNQIRDAMTGTISGLTGSVQSLADVGITTNISDGSLSLDKTMLDKALSSSPESVGKLFAAYASSTDNLVTYKGSTTDTIEGTYSLNVNQAASQASITGAATSGANITLDGTNNTLQVSVDGTTSSSLTLATGTYTPADLAKEIAAAINNDSNISDNGAKVSVQYDSSTMAFTINSNKYGSASKISLDSGSLLTSGVTGLAVTAQQSGNDVMGYLQATDGTQYTFAGTGQNVTINSYLDGAPRGLSFSVGGTQTGSRGTLDFHRGFADKLNQLFTQFSNTTDGLVGTRISNIQTKLNDLKDQQTKIDDRYNTMLLKYKTQFGALQSLLAQMGNTQQSLSNSLSALKSSSKG